MMQASQTTRRTCAYAGAGAFLAAGALAAGIAGQPVNALADDAQGDVTYDAVDGAADQADEGATYADVAPAQDGTTGQAASGDAQADNDPVASADASQADPSQAATYPAETDPAEGCTAVGVSGSYATTQAQALLDQINQIRAEAAEEGIVGADGQVVSGSPLTWSTGLEHAAQIRAVESSYSFSHTRPDGRGTVLGSGTDDGQDNTFAAAEGTVIWAENLAQAADADDALALWYAEKDAYLAHLAGDDSVDEGDYGHYLALISDDYSFIGLGAFTADSDGSTYLAAEFSNAASDSQLVRPDGACTQQINVEAAAEQVSVPDVTGMSGDEARQALEEAGLTVAVVTGEPAADPSQNGLVYGQDPLAGTLVEAGSQVTLTVYADYQAPVATGVEAPANVQTEAGTAPVLPETASVTWSDGSTTDEPVTWDEIDPASYAQAGSFKVAGTVGSTGLTVEVTVEVAAAQVNVPDVFGMTADEAQQALEEAGLTVAVVTGEPAADPSQNGLVYGQDPLAGTLVEAGSQVNVTVYADYQAPVATGVEAPANVQTEAGTAPVLPETASVTWSDGSTTDEPVTWDEIDPASYAQAGSFTVEGTVGSTGLTVEVTVEVAAKAAPTVESVEDVTVTTASGTAPALPATVTAHMSDGTSTDLPVTWDGIDPAAYSAREGGSFDVAGTVEGFDAGAVAHVTVQPATIASVTDPAPLTTFVGHAPELPATVSATWTNGDVTDQPVEWEQLLGLTADGKGTWDFAGDVSLTGTVEGTDLPAHVTVSVVEPGVASVAAIADVETQAGTAPKLPETVQVSWEDGSVTDEQVTWDAVSPDSYAKKGSFTVEGTVAGAGNAKVSVKVNVAGQAAISSVAAPAGVTTPSGTAPALPASTTVTWDDGTTTEGIIAWDAVDAASYTARAGGEFDVHGTVSATHGTGDDAVSATADVTVHVTVSPATVVSVEQPAALTTRAKNAPDLPATVKVTWSNGDVTDEPVTWDDVSSAAWNVAGTVTVRGTVGQTGQTLSCTVTVQAAKAVSTESVEVTTTVGTAPQLPATVKVTWDDGSTTFEAVKWADVSADMYAKQGSFQVNGTAAGLTVTARVTVNGPDIVKTADPSASPALTAMLGAGGLLAVMAGALLKRRARRGL